MNAYNGDAKARKQRVSALPPLRRPCSTWSRDRKAGRTYFPWRRWSPFPVGGSPFVTASAADPGDRRRRQMALAVSGCCFAACFLSIFLRSCVASARERAGHASSSPSPSSLSALVVATSGCGGCTIRSVSCCVRSRGQHGSSSWQTTTLGREAHRRR